MEKFDIKNINPNLLLKLLQNGRELKCPVCSHVLEYSAKDILGDSYLKSLKCPVDNTHYCYEILDSCIDLAEAVNAVRTRMNERAKETNKTLPPKKLIKMAIFAIEAHNYDYAIELLEIALTKTAPDN